MMYLLVIAVLLLGIEIVYFHLAYHLNIVDKPNERSSHTKTTLRGGGIIFPVASLLFFCMSRGMYPWFMLGLAMISVISFWDDLKPLSTRIRLGTHFLTILIMFHQFGLPELAQSVTSIWLIPALLVLCAGIINAYNFMDGINGITGGYSLVVLGTLAWVNHFQIHFAAPGMLEFILISLLVFNFFNFRTKARCFAGDVGSVSIAYILLFVLGFLMLKTRDFSWICFLAVYGVDSVLTIFHRILLRENISKPHRKHLYQLLANELKIPHVFVSSIYAGIQFVIIIGYLVCRPLGSWMLWSYIGVVVFLLTGSYIVTKRKCFPYCYSSPIAPRKSVEKEV